MKRLKTVFGSQSEVTHIWAQQTQEHGRSGNIFFERTTDIYSYGYHYLMAKVHTVKGKRFALVNSHRYSSSTSQHLSHTRSALNGLMPYFEVRDPSDVQSSIKELDERVFQRIEEALKRRCFVGNYWNAPGNFELSAIRDAYKESTALRKIIGLKALPFPEKNYEAARAHILKLRRAWKKREAKKNDPEEVKRRREEREKREARKLPLAIEKFRAGKALSACADLRGLEYDLIRIVDSSRIQTSRGAFVELLDAKMLLRAIDSGKKVLGEKIGHYTVTGIEARENDKLIKVGCHRILLSEAHAVLNAPALSLVTA